MLPILCKVGGVLIVTGTIFGNNNNGLGGGGVLSAGQLSVGNNMNCASGGCPIMSITNCNSGSGNVCNANAAATNTCSTNFGGIVASDQSTCGSSLDPISLNASGYSGTILRWESSTNGGTSWTGILSTISDTYDPPSISTTTIYRTVILNTATTPCNSYSTYATANVGGPAAAGTITGASTVCLSSSGIVYSVPFINGATSYTWAYSGTGATITGTGNSVSIDFSPSATSGNLTVRGVNSCGNGTISANKAITVNNSTAPTVNQPSNQTVCAGTNTTAVTFSGTGAGVTYSWINNDNTIGLGSSGTGNIGAFSTINNNVNPNFATITVTPSTSSCTGSPKSFTYTINTVPAPAGLISGASTVCRSTAGYIYTVPGISQATSYTWAYTGTGATITNNGSTITIAFDGSATNGNLTVRGTNSCGNGTISSNFAITVATGSAPTVNQPSNQTTCDGASTSTITFTGTGATSFNWSNDNTLIGLANSGTGNIPSFTASNGGVSALIGSIVVIPVNATCSGAGKTFTITVNPTLTPSVSLSITSGSNPACNGSSVTFTATPSNGGASPTYQWTKNNVNISGANSVTYTGVAGTDFVNSDAIRCVLTSNASCANPTTGTSSPITMTVNSSVTPSVTIAVTSGSNPTCSGNSVTFTATPTNGGASPTYQWTKNGSNIGGATSVTYSGTAGTDFVNSDAIRCVITSNATCPSPTTGTSSPITMTVNSTVTPSVTISITSGTNPTCSGNSVTFTATPTNGGASPTYQWTKNNVNISGATSVTYTGVSGTDFVNTDAIRCVMTSNATCPSPATGTSSSITMTVNSTVTPSVSIAITSGSQTICSGTSVTFTATPTNGGGSPTYNFRIGGISAQNSSSATFTTSSLVNNDVVDCIITSNATCASPATATSNNFTMTVNSVTPTISISNNQTSVCTGMVFTASISNGGSSPTYQWKKGGLDISGETNSTYTGVALAANDAITCVLTSNASCQTASTTTSNTINVSLTVPTTTWTGNTDSNWGDAGNWSSGVPSKDLTAIIPDANSLPNSPLLNTSAEVYSLNLQASSTLFISGTNTLTIYGSIINDGTFTPNSSTISMVGCPGTTGIAHNISSTNNSSLSVANLTLNDVAGATLNVNASISNTLRLTNGTFTNNNKIFTFISTLTRTARIAAITGGSYSGNITMQRMAPGGLTGWAWLGSPVTNSTLADWYNNNTEIPMSGFPGVSYAIGGTTNFKSVYTYDETASGLKGSAASYIVPTNVTNSLVNGLGYWVYFGNGAVNTTAITFDVTGTPKTGNVNFPVTYSNFGAPLEDGWNLVANPYPSNINWAATGGAWTKNNIDNTIYIYNADINNYATFTSSPLDSTNGGSRFIPSSQGFEVHATGTPTLSCTENAKSSVVTTFLRTASSASNMVGMRFKINKENSVLTDECVVRFDDNAINGYDISLDAPKLFPTNGSSINITTISENNHYTRNFLQSINSSTEIPVSIMLNGNGKYTVDISEISNLINENPAIFDNNNLVIEDIKTGKITNLNSDLKYNFEINNGEENVNLLVRFAKQDVKAENKSELFNTIQVKNVNKNILVTLNLSNSSTSIIEIINMNGQVVNTQNSSIQNGTVTIYTQELNSGIYIVKVNNGSKTYTKKLFIN